MQIEPLDLENAAQLAEWDAFVAHSPQASFFHLSNWARVLQKAFGFKIHYLVARSEDNIIAILPLTHVRRPMLINAMISNPLCVHCGPVGNAVACTSLLNHAQELSKQVGADYLEVRSLTPLGNEFEQVDHNAYFIKPLPDSIEAILTDIPRKQRAEVRRGFKSGLTAKFDQDISDFYPIYANSVHGLGTPVFPRAYAKLLFDIFEDQCRILTVRKDNQPVTSVLTFYFRDTIMPYYGGGRPQARSVGAYHFMYHQLMELGFTDGFKIFDFGRSAKGSGAYNFKRYFGFEPQDLHYGYKRIKIKQLPDMDPISQRNSLITGIWQKLPAPIVNRAGPLLYPVVV